MAKKNLGKFLALATITGAVAAGISYFMKYRSFHAELEEDFHDFEDDDSFDGTLPHEGEAASRNYVPLGEKKEEEALASLAEDVPENTAADESANNDEDKASTPPATTIAATTIEEDHTND